MNDDHDPRLDAGLREVLGGIAPPDLRREVRARLALREGYPAGRRRSWLGAALALLGLTVVLSLAIERTSPPVLPLSSPQEPIERGVVRAREDLRKLAPNAQRLQVQRLAAADLTLLARFRELRELELWNGIPVDGAVLAEDDLAALRALTKLQKLTLLGPWTGVGLAALDSLPMLEEISLLGTHVHKDGLAAIAKLPNLRRLHVRHAQGLDRDAVPVLVGMTHLRALSLVHVWKVPKAGFFDLAKMTGLEELDVGDNDGGERSSRMGEAGDGIGVDDEVLAALATLPKLRRLSLNRCFHVTPAGMAALAKLADLRALDLTALGSCVPAALDALPATLRELRLEHCQIDAETLGRLVAKQPQLEDLDLSYGGTDRLDLQRLGELPNLRRLAVRDTKAALVFASGVREHMEPVPVLRSLRVLDLDRWAAITVRDCERFAAMPLLEELHLAGVAMLDDAMLGALGRSRSLRHLAVGGKNAITMEGLRRLRDLKLAVLDVQVLGATSGDLLRLVTEGGPFAESVRSLAAELWPNALVVLPDGSQVRSQDK